MLDGLLLNDDMLLFAYVGPGAGLTMLGALAVVLGVLLLAILAPLLYPIHVARAWLRRRHARQVAGMPAASLRIQARDANRQSFEATSVQAGQGERPAR